ncbi:hypothetical protein LTR56_007295 [Elasticomyces elasticus]|nr:hypothetical protein LTR56_007295 [Elasticomyces elasticus]KAK3662972.1 hypothetical protein LTR22_006136 [Elasticomyces elasticus]KAK5753794.1 hypothetical protein LTS12_016103 [Elasticomyces elasticus]
MNVLRGYYQTVPNPSSHTYFTLRLTRRDTTAVGPIQTADGGLNQSFITGPLYDFSAPNQVHAATALAADLYEAADTWKGAMAAVPLTLMYMFDSSNHKFGLQLVQLYHELCRNCRFGVRKGAGGVAETIMDLFGIPRIATVMDPVPAQWHYATASNLAISMQAPRPQAAQAGYPATMQAQGTASASSLVPSEDHVRAQVSYVHRLVVRSRQDAWWVQMCLNQGYAATQDPRLAYELSEARRRLVAMQMARDDMLLSQGMAQHVGMAQYIGIGIDSPSSVPSQAHGSHVCGRNAAIPIVAPPQEAAIVDVPSIGAHAAMESTPPAEDYTEPGTKAASKRPARQYTSEIALPSRISSAQTDLEPSTGTPYFAQETMDTAPPTLQPQPSPQPPATISPPITPPLTPPSLTSYSHPSPRVRNLLSHLPRLSTSSHALRKSEILARFQAPRKSTWKPCQWWDTKNGIHCGDCDLCAPIFEIRREEMLAAFRPQGIVVWEEGMSVREV